MSSLRVTGYRTNYVEQSVRGGLCSSEKPHFQLFHPSVRFRDLVCPFCVNVGLFINIIVIIIIIIVNVYFHACECVNFFFPLFCLFFSISIATVSVFPFLALYFKAPIPLFHIQQLFQPKPHALFFLTFALYVFKNGFFFLIALSLSLALSLFFILNLIIIIIIIVKCIWRNPLCIIL